MLTKDDLREMAENDLELFIALVSPERVLGQCHKDVIRWWQKPDAKSHQLLLFPRDHQKSALIAYRVAQALAKDPTLRILYISATSNLAEKQLFFIKSILESEVFREYWPEHVHPDVSKRARWTNSEIILDHPRRKEEKVRDPSIFTAGLTTSITGMHCDIVVMDDVVIHENAYNETARKKVALQTSYFASIASTDARFWVVGTRYHPRDLYQDLMEKHVPVFDSEGNIVGEEPLYEVYEKPVEDKGDGTGQFLWPRQQRKDGKWFGFDAKILAIKRAQYNDLAQFRAQYYNDPSDPDNQPVKTDWFNYFSPESVQNKYGQWFVGGRKVNIVAAMDLAYTIGTKSDYTAIVVAGVDADGNYYVLDIDRFQSESISDYYKRLKALYNKWGFNKVVMEVSGPQKAIVRSIKEDYLLQDNVAIRIVEVDSRAHKEDRIDAILIPKYEAGVMYHYKGGNILYLEEELLSTKPPHDDVKDALAYAVEHLAKPSKATRPRTVFDTYQNNVIYHPKFGGRVA